MIERRERERERERCKGYRERGWKEDAQSTPVQGVRSRRISSENLPSGDIKKGWLLKLSRDNYDEWKLWGEIITGNYELVYQSRGKCEIYRDTGVSKNGTNYYSVWCSTILFLI